MDIFLVVKDIHIASYADDSTPCIDEDDIDNLITSLEEASNYLFDCFKNNRVKSNVSCLG